MRDQTQNAARVADPLRSPATSGHSGYHAGVAGNSYHAEGALDGGKVRGGSRDIRMPSAHPGVSARSLDTLSQSGGRSALRRMQRNSSPRCHLDPRRPLIAGHVGVGRRGDSFADHPRKQTLGKASAFEVGTISYLKTKSTIASWSTPSLSTDTGEIECVTKRPMRTESFRP
jgi:hypothetical protein